MGALRAHLQAGDFEYSFTNRFSLMSGRTSSRPGAELNTPRISLSFTSTHSGSPTCCATLSALWMRSCRPCSDQRVRRSLLRTPGGTVNLQLFASGFTPLFRNRSVHSRRASLHVGPVYRAIVSSLNPASLRRPAVVVRDRRHVGDV